jgi:hypothetical protein
MKRCSNILILILIYLVCSARTCTEESSTSGKKEEQLLEAAIDSIRNDTENRAPDYMQLRAFEETARQKLSDLADYLKIASDTSLDIAFRRQAADMAKRLFFSQNPVIRNWSAAYKSSDLKTLTDLLNQSLEKGFDSWLIPSQTVVSKELAPVNDSVYSGRLNFRQNLFFANGRKPSADVPGVIEIDIFVIKRLKVFGNEKLNIWNVYLGDI